MQRSIEIKRLHTELAEVRQSLQFAWENRLPIIKELKEREQKIKDIIMELSTDD